MHANEASTNEATCLALVHQDGKEKSWPHAPCLELARATETVSQILLPSFESLLASILSKQQEK